MFRRLKNLGMKNYEDLRVKKLLRHHNPLRFKVLKQKVILPEQMSNFYLTDLNFIESISE